MGIKYNSHEIKNILPSENASKSPWDSVADVPFAGERVANTSTGNNPVGTQNNANAAPKFHINIGKTPYGGNRVNTMPQVNNDTLNAMPQVSNNTERRPYTNASSNNLYITPEDRAAHPVSLDDYSIDNLRKSIDEDKNASKATNKEYGKLSSFFRKIIKPRKTG